MSANQPTNPLYVLSIYVRSACEHPLPEYAVEPPLTRYTVVGEAHCIVDAAIAGANLSAEQAAAVWSSSTVQRLLNAQVTSKGAYDYSNGVTVVAGPVDEVVTRHGVL